MSYLQEVADFGSDSSQNDSLVWLGLLFDGHKTIQLLRDVGCYENTFLKSSSINRHTRQCTVHVRSCEWECICVCGCMKTLSHGYLSCSGDLDTLRQRMNISLDSYGGNRGECFLLEFCSVTAANGILCEWRRLAESAHLRVLESRGW